MWDIIVCEDSKTEQLNVVKILFISLSLSLALSPSIHPSSPLYQCSSLSIYLSLYHFNSLSLLSSLVLSVYFYFPSCVSCVRSAIHSVFPSYYLPASLSFTLCFSPSFSLKSHISQLSCLCQVAMTRPTLWPTDRSMQYFLGDDPHFSISIQMCTSLMFLPSFLPACVHLLWIITGRSIRLYSCLWSNTADVLARHFHCACMESVETVLFSGNLVFFPPVELV